MTFARVRADSGLTGIDLGAMYGVSRQTILAWGDGNTPHSPAAKWPAGYPVARFEVITRALVTAIERGLLPLPAMSRAARKARVTKMASTLQGLKSK